MLLLEIIYLFAFEFILIFIFFVFRTVNLEDKGSMIAVFMFIVGEV
jgi:hypothetical protein